MLAMLYTRWVGALMIGVVAARGLVVAALAAGVIATVASLVGLDARATAGARTSGDEPHYLLTAVSLASDGDLDVDDELAAHRYRDFHAAPLDPQSEPRAGGQRLSPHDPLLPVLLTPGVAVAGWIGAKATLALLAGLTAAAATWVAVARFGVAPGVGALVVGGLGATMPLAPYGAQVYPEVPAALATVVAVGLLLAPRPGRLHLAGSVLAVVALPWLSVKYVPVALALVGVGGVRLRRRGARRDGLAAAVVLALAGVTYVVFHLRIYGGLTVYAAGDHFAETGELSVVGVDPDYASRTRRLVGLLVDRTFGLGPWSPAWLLAPAAVAALVARRVPGRAVLVAPLAAGWATATWLALTMHGWWLPGRQVVVVLPLAAVAVAVLVDRWRPLVPVVAVAVGAGILNWAWLARGAAGDGPTLIVDFADTAAWPYRAVAGLFPDGTTGSAAADAALLAWAGVLGLTALAAVALGHPVGRRRWRRRPGRGTVVAAVTAAATVAAVAGLVTLVEGDALAGAVADAAGDPVGVVVAVGAFGLAFVLRGLAWARVLPGLGPAQAVAAVHVALGANHVLPLRLGEPLRVVSVVRRAGVGAAEATATTVVLRAADVLAVVGIGALAGPPIATRLVGGWGVTVLAVVGVVGAVALASLPALRRAGSTVRWPGPAVLGLTAAGWLLEAVTVWQVARWFGVELTPAEALVVLAVAVGSQLVAVTPGGIGTYEAAGTAALVAVGVPFATGLAVMVGVHAVTTIYSVASGVVALVVPAPGLLGRWRLPPSVASRPPPAPGPGPVVLFLPAHDEGPRVGAVVSSAPARVRDRPVEVVVVDDASGDDTVGRARSAGACVVGHRTHRGLGAAVRTGLGEAVDRGAAAVAFCDADGEYDPGELDRLVGPILDGRAHLVVGSRFAGHIERMTPHRRLGNRLLTAWVAWVVRRPVTDGQSGYRALSAEAAAAATVAHDYNYAQVLTVELIGAGFGYTEVPISYRSRESGRSFVRLGPYLRRVVPAVWRLLNPAPRGPGSGPAPPPSLRRPRFRPLASR